MALTSNVTNQRVFFTAWFLFALHFSTNIVREHYPAFSIAERGSFKVDEYQGLHADIFVHRDGHSYIGNNVATSVIASIPLYAVGPALDRFEEYEKGRGVVSRGYRTQYPNRQQFFREVAERGLSLRFGAAAAVTSLFLVAPLSALCVLGLFRLLQERGITAGRAAWLAMVFGFGTPLFFRTAHLSNNLFVMYATFASYWFLRDRPGGNDVMLPIRRFAAGVCAGLAIAFDYSGIVSLVCLYGFLILLQLRTVGVVTALRSSIPFIVGCVPPVGFLMYSQWAMYGDPFLPGQYWMPSVNYTERGWRGFAGPNVDVFLLNLLHPSYGLFWFGPLLVLGILAAVFPPRVLTTRPERWFTIAFASCLLIFCAANQYSLMQWNSGFRYLLPLVPFLFLAACELLVRWNWKLVVAIGVLAIGHTWVLCTARDCNPTFDTWRLSTSLPHFLEQLGGETVPASYQRVFTEGPQPPWLRVMRQTMVTDYPILGQPWLAACVFAAAAVLVAGFWMTGRNTPKNAMATSSEALPQPNVAVVIPVLNEAHVLEKSVSTLLGYLREEFPYPARIVIADNGSTDGTGEIARRLVDTYEDVEMISLTQRGRGRALRSAWTESDAQILAYMDVDLSTELPALEKLCRAIHEEGCDLATGSRLLPQSRITRSLKREILSRGYNFFVKWVLWTHFSDAQCGFKAISKRVAIDVLPLIENQHWFFDTELLVLGEKLGYRIKDVSVRWLEDPDSRVKIAATVWEDIKGVFRLRRLLWSGRLRGRASSVWPDRPAEVNAETSRVPTATVGSA